MIGTLVKLKHDINIYPNSGSDIYKNEVCIIIEEYTRRDFNGDNTLETAYKIRSLTSNKTSSGIIIGNHVRLLTAKELAKHKAWQVLYG